MSVVERAKAHRDGQPRERIEVPEWGEVGKPLVITWTPMTVRQHSKCYPAGKPVDARTGVTVLILKAQDEAGRPLFTDADRPTLEDEVDGAVVGRIVSAILGSRLSVRNSEKN